jgi:mono/diheme cytochrome c family protein
MMTARMFFTGFLVAISAATAVAQDAAIVDKGKQVYDYWCATCHGAGRGRPGTAALAAKYKGGDRSALLAERTDLTPQSIRVFTRNGVSIMPMFRKTEVSDADLDAIIAYLTRRRAPGDATSTSLPKQP